MLYSGISKRRSIMETVTKKELWMQQAPSFNFELGEDALLKKALEVGFVTKTDKDQYLVNEEYKSCGK
tara:strand:- start:278 stop:481 length:204 start_codon:yes stop_codon:yes gene_type:complete